MKIAHLNHTDELFYVRIVITYVGGDRYERNYNKTIS